MGMMPGKFIVYALTDPRDGCPRYVGQTIHGMLRYRSHLKNLPNDASHHKKAWVQTLQAQGLNPGFEVLTDLPGPEFLDEAEAFWIAELKARGCQLTNLVMGGPEGERIHSPETQHLTTLNVPLIGPRRPRYDWMLEQRRVKEVFDRHRGCPGCLEHPPLERNGQCRTCNKKQGLRQCRRCLEFLPEVLSFTLKEICSGCAKGKGPKPSLDGQVVQSLRDMGLGVKAIARIFSVTPPTVRRALRRVTPE